MLHTESDTEPLAVQGTIRLHAIELFVIHLTKKNPSTFCGFGDHYRVLMRIVTSGGCGWGEMYFNEGNRPVDWTAWASWFEQVLHRNFKSVSSIETGLISNLRPFHLARLHLLCDALQGLSGTSGRGLGAEGEQVERSILMNTAEAYVSLF
ncbi:MULTISPECIES: hypothetical protein [Paenibacillus]|uniref:Uncharacterized protein n=1 Tax=Paenibacillus albilobatus TaxID=2716884 RepID=A0A919XJ88_9BACL|nr:MULTISPECIES: hypothetical protein [Paenibacillus]GIO31875.1 hypothetical protein J2TS6_30160 [Paenibacillus albilobatus]